jgi:histidinol-phosphate phosphatase family protein
MFEAPSVRAVLLDRDGTLVRDVPYNGDPELVEPMPLARDALERLRSAGLGLAVVSNQSGIGRGLLTRAQVDAVNQRIDDLLGPLDGFFLCPHVASDGCDCRKPQPGLVLAAASAFGVSPAACVVIGDIGADVEAARRAGARAILVPTRATRPAEIDEAPATAGNLLEAASVLLGEVA